VAKFFVRLSNKIVGLHLAPFNEMVENHCCRSKKNVNYHNILLSSQKIIDVTDKKQMYASVFTGQENASKSGIALYRCFWRVLISIFVWLCMCYV